MNGNTPIRSSENCPDTYVVATVFSYDESSDSYYASGKTELSNSPSLLHRNVNKFVFQSSGRVKFNYGEVPTLQEYTPFSENVDIPDDKIVGFERSLSTIGQLRTQEARPGLRDRTTLKSTFHPDYISNA